MAAGHLGTLDPQAAGVLPVAIGKATRLIPLLPVQSKRYACTIVFGRTTTTQDALGETVSEAEVPGDWRERLARAIAQFTGSIEQIPPMFSAVHHEGRRLYEIARAGETRRAQSAHGRDRVARLCSELTRARRPRVCA